MPVYCTFLKTNFAAGFVEIFARKFFCKSIYNKSKFFDHFYDSFGIAVGYL